MKCKGCGHKILDHHEMIIDVQSIENRQGAVFWHGDCFSKMILNAYIGIEYLTKDEIKEINKSIEEIRKGNYKEGNINELLKDLKEGD